MSLTAPPFPMANPSTPPFPPLPMSNATPEQKMAMAQQSVQAAQQSPIPTLKELDDTQVDLPAGWIDQNGVLHRTALVRELNGFDEEALSHFDPFKNIAEFVTELLCRGVESIGDTHPDKQLIQTLLIGDREALLLGIRRATYGDTVEQKMVCPNCEEDNDITIELSKDVPVKSMDDPLTRVFDVELRHGTAKVRLVNGTVQEAFSAALSKKTPAEINTLMLSKSVVEINGQPVLSPEQVKALSKMDRETLIDFIAEHQPGPDMRDISVPCATCREEMMISLTLGNLFRF